jgi:hypothetical protein
LPSLQSDVFLCFDGGFLGGAFGIMIESDFTRMLLVTDKRRDN